MKKLFPWMAMIFLVTGCGGMTFATRVRNQSGVTLSVAGGTDANSAAEAVTIANGRSGICSGVVYKQGHSVSWAISDGQTRYIYNDVSQIGNLHDSSATYSVLTRQFPRNRVTRQVMVDTNMSISAVAYDGSEVHQPNGFPIHYSSKVDLLKKY